MLSFFEAEAGVEPASPRAPAASFTEPQTVGQGPGVVTITPLRLGWILELLVLQLSTESLLG